MESYRPNIRRTQLRMTHSKGVPHAGKWINHPCVEARLIGAAAQRLLFGPFGETHPLSAEWVFPGEDPSRHLIEPEKCNAVRGGGA